MRGCFHGGDHERDVKNIAKQWRTGRPRIESLEFQTHTQINGGKRAQNRFVKIVLASVMTFGVKMN